MEKLIKRRYIESYEDDEVLILKIFEKKGKFKYTVQWGDGPSHRADTLIPFLESKYSFTNENDAEFDAEIELSELFGNNDEE